MLVRFGYISEISVKGKTITETDTFVLTEDEEKQHFYYRVSGGNEYYAERIVKKDKDTGNVITYSNATFTLYKLNKNTNLYKAVRKAEEMQTVWFTKDYVWEYCEKEILKNVKKFEYYENGVYYN